MGKGIKKGSVRIHNKNDLLITNTRYPFGKKKYLYNFVAKDMKIPFAENGKRLDRVTIAMNMMRMIEKIFWELLAEMLIYEKETFVSRRGRFKILIGNVSPKSRSYKYQIKYAGNDPRIYIIFNKSNLRKVNPGYALYFKPEWYYKLLREREKGVEYVSYNKFTVNGKPEIHNA